MVNFGPVSCEKHCPLSLDDFCPEPGGEHRRMSLSDLSPSGVDYDTLVLRRRKEREVQGRRGRKTRPFLRGRNEKVAHTPSRGMHPSSHVPSLRRVISDEPFTSTPPEAGSSSEHPQQTSPSPSRSTGGFGHYPGQNSNGGNRVASASSDSSSMSATQVSPFESDWTKRNAGAGSPPHMPPVSISCPRIKHD